MVTDEQIEAAKRQAEAIMDSAPYNLVDTTDYSVMAYASLLCAILTAGAEAEVGKAVGRVAEQLSSISSSIGDHADKVGDVGGELQTIAAAVGQITGG